MSRIFVKKHSDRGNGDQKGSGSGSKAMVGGGVGPMAKGEKHHLTRKCDWWGNGEKKERFWSIVQARR